MTRVSDSLGLLVQIWTSNLWASLVGDLSDREGYDFEQLRSITKTLVRLGHLLSCPSANIVDCCT